MLTTFAFLSAFVCLTQRSCVRGRTVEMALESDSLLLPHVAPWSFRPVGVGRAVRSPGGALLRGHGLGALTRHGHAGTTSGQPVRGGG